MCFGKKYSKLFAAELFIFSLSLIFVQTTNAGNSVSRPVVQQEAIIYIYNLAKEGKMTCPGRPTDIVQVRKCLPMELESQKFDLNLVQKTVRELDGQNGELSGFGDNRVLKYRFANGYTLQFGVYTLELHTVHMSRI